MNFQSAIRFDQAYGIPGEILFDGPTRAQPGILNSANAVNNVFGRVFSETAATPGTWRAGDPDGLGVRWAIMIDPKEHVAFGTAAGGALAPTLQIPNGVIAAFATMGFICAVTSVDANVGDIVRFVKLTGEVQAAAPDAVDDPLLQNLPAAAVVRVPQPNAPGLIVVSLTQ